MKTIVSLLEILFSLLGILFSLQANANSGTWSYGAVVTNPTSSTVFVTFTVPTSGSSATPPSANYVVGGFFYCSVVETYEIQVLNASSVVQSTLTLSQPGQYPFPFRMDGVCVLSQRLALLVSDRLNFFTP